MFVLPTINFRLQLISSSATKKKLIIGASVAAALLIIVGIIVGVVLINVLNKSKYSMMFQMKNQRSYLV